MGTGEQEICPHIKQNMEKIKINIRIYIRSYDWQLGTAALSQPLPLISLLNRDMCGLIGGELCGVRVSP